ncbi:MAG TPA: serine/threonine-protein kinase [Polyangia bacterium]|nr:serine/threonine-protein kinase [Polyangia bacterium]
MDDDDAQRRPTVGRPPAAKSGAPTRLVDGAEMAEHAAAHVEEPPAAEADRYLGTTIGGRYKIVEKLGEGGMGVVYLAEHVALEKRVAVKVLSGDFAKRRDLVERFAREAKSASKIGHENIINITDFGETPSGSAFFAMEYLQGHDLAHHVRASGPMPIERVVRIAAQVCRALGAAHAKGIVHRDLKPDNIFIVEREGPPDFVKVLDFGLAKVSMLEGEARRLTRTGMIFGTAEYMSPEQARGEHADHRSDVYALGCILFELLTGAVPFRATSFMGLLRKHIEEAPDAPSARVPQVTPALDSVVLKALAKDRESRFQTMKELALALSAATDVDPKAVWGSQEDALPRTMVEVRAEPSESEVSFAFKRSPRRAAAIVGLALVAAAGAAWLALARRTAAKSESPPIAAPAIAPAQSSASAPVAAPAVAPAAAPRASRVAVLSTPAGADVMSGVERLGATPLELTLAPSSAPLDVTVEHKGYRPQKLHLEPDRDHEYVVQLVALPKPVRAPPPAAAPPPKPPQPPIPRELKPIE